jgi:hypothetical protein
VRSVIPRSGDWNGSAAVERFSRDDAAIAVVSEQLEVELELYVGQV